MGIEYALRQRDRQLPDVRLDAGKMHLAQREHQIQFYRGQALYRTQRSSANDALGLAPHVKRLERSVLYLCGDLVAEIISTKYLSNSGDI